MSEKQSPNRKRPIFIGGLGRSGTTLLSIMLDSHHDIKCGPELHFRAPKDLGPYILQAMIYVDDKDYPDNFRPGVMFIQRVKRLGIMPIELVNTILAIKDGYIGKDDTFQRFPDRCVLIDRLCELAMDKTAKIRWGLKIMTDIGSHFQEYAQHWPNAQFIHIIKDPRDNIKNLFKVPWGPSTIEAGAKQWVKTIERSRRKANQCNADLYEIQSNDLVLYTEPTIRKLLEWLGHDYDPNVLRYYEMPHSFFDHPAGHPSARQVIRPLDPSNIGKYKEEFTEEQIKTIEELTMPYIKELGYLNAGIA